MKKFNLRIFLQLIKATVSLPVTFLCFAGYYMHSNQISLHIWLACAGVFLLSASSSAFNQIIEQKYDALMDRTKNRPLPAGKISTKTALILAVILTFMGAALLLYLSILAFSLGILAIGWYIIVYTLLKRITPFATIPGALVGALPLLIGWTASGGNIFNPHILVIAAFTYIWQIPHFWLLMLVYGKDYEKAGFPTLYRVFSERNLKFWTLCWIITAAIYSLGLIPFGIVQSAGAKFALVLTNLTILSLSTYFLFYQKQGQTKGLFHLLNLFMVLTIIIALMEGIAIS